MPANVEEQVIQSYDTHYININALKQQADVNLELRKNEVVKCEELIRTKIEQFKAIHKERKIELAFGEIPTCAKCY